MLKVGGKRNSSSIDLIASRSRPWIRNVHAVRKHLAFIEIELYAMYSYALLGLAATYRPVATI
jgi:hypothetical protein